MTGVDLKPVRELWLREAAESDLGLWWVANDLRELLGENASEEDVRLLTIEGLKPLLDSGELRAVDLLEAGRFRVWSGTVETQLAKIESGWKQVGRPDIGDVVWFIGLREQDST